MRFSGISLTATLATCGSTAAAMQSTSSNDNVDTVTTVTTDLKQLQHRRAVLQALVKGDDIRNRVNSKNKRILQHQTLGTQPQLQHIYHSSRLKNSQAPVACVPPTALASFATQDWLGVLSCGTGEYCVESDSSHLGGFCQQQEQNQALPPRSRKLQYCWDAVSYCSGIEPDVEYCADYDQVLPTCGCEDFNTTVGVGFISCQVPNFCITVRPSTEFAPCDPTCYDAISNSTFSDTFVSSITCLTFTEPYTQTFCRGYSQTFLDNGMLAETSCNMSLNGVYCDSCSVANFQGVPQNNSFYFDTWDCTNIGLGSSPEGSFASRFLVDAPLLTGDPDCTKTDPPRPVEVPTRSPPPSSDLVDLASSPPTSDLVSPPPSSNRTDFDSPPPSSDRTDLASPPPSSNRTDLASPPPSSNRTDLASPPPLSDRADFASPPPSSGQVDLDTITSTTYAAAAFTFSTWGTTMVTVTAVAILGTVLLISDHL
jgi:hypothetical protein